MFDGRQQLPVGTEIQLESGSVYRISGNAIGFGGGSIVYPAQKLTRQDGQLQPDGFSYALKECYPVCPEYAYIHDPEGTVVPRQTDGAAQAYLARVQELQLREGTISREIYHTASRMVPVRETARRAVYSLPGQPSATVENTVTVMESISNKGRSIGAILEEKRRFSGVETFRILQQLLFALAEVHRAGYLHLDIQDGNVFLRGTLREKSEILTLIDFGAARPFREGKTEPIADRVIFASPGFTAPEILHGNDGTLRLGPEADLYSVGCMALYLLTGHKPNGRTLLMGSTGSFLTQRQLSRAGIPRHLEGTLQQYLAKALAPLPEDRYHTAQEMLADTGEILQALQPHRTELEAVKYDAFVCYKHGVIDSAAAVALQRALESYRAPRDMGKGRKPFRRVFVDEGELSSCADFGCQIRQALKNSGWLIVICSPQTPASPWVKLEIDTFLEYHDRSRILAVLTAGEPEESYPPQLMGGGQTGQVLAADARGATEAEVRRLLRRDALLKVAAPMLGTTFDGLKQRQRIYRTRRIAAAAGLAFAVTAGFAAFAGNRAKVISGQAAEINRQAERIQEEYTASLINESRFLAEQAQKRLEENDTLGAVELALQALPSEDRDRPVLPQAQYVLSQALGVYRTPKTIGNYAENVGLIDPNLVNYYSMYLNEDGSRLLVVSDKTIQCWDTQTMTKCWNLHGESIYNTSQVVFLPGTAQVLAETGSKLSCLDMETGKTLWEVAVDHLIGFQLMADSDTVLVWQGTEGELMDCTCIDLVRLSPETGRELSRSSFPLGFSFDSYDIQELTVSRDGKWGAGVYFDYFHEEEPQRLLLMDLTRGTLRQVELEPLPANKFAMEERQRLCFVGDQLLLLRDNSALAQLGDGYHWDRVSQGGASAIERYDPATGRRVWRTEQTHYSAGGGEWLLEVPQKDGQEECVLAVSDRLCQRVALRNGAVLDSWTLESPAVDVEVREDGFRTVNYDGSLTNAFFDRNYLYSWRQFQGPVSRVCRKDNTYYIADGEQEEEESGLIRKYRMSAPPENYQVLAQGTEERWKPEDVQSLGISPDGASLTLGQYREGWYWEESTGTNRQITLPDRYDGGEPLGASEDGKRVYFHARVDKGTENVREVLVELDMTTGKTRQAEYPVEYAQPLGIWKDRLVFTVPDHSEDTAAVYLWDPWQSEPVGLAQSPAASRRDLSKIPQALQDLCWNVKMDVQGWVWIPYYLPEEKHLGLIELNLETEETKDRDISWLLPEIQEMGDWAYQVAFYPDETGEILGIALQDHFYATDQAGKLLFTVSGADGNAQVKGACFLPDGSRLAVSFSQGTIGFYRTTDGEPIWTLDLLPSCQSLSTPEISKWEWTKEGRLLAYADEETFLLDVSDGTAQVAAVIPSCIGYDPYGSRYLTLDNDDGIGQLNCLSVEELVSWGEKLLGR